MKKGWVTLALFAATFAAAGICAAQGSDTETTPPMQGGTMGQAPSRGPLDGTRFVGRLTAEGKKKGDKDTLIFKDGTFDSVACRHYGFKPSPYTAEAAGGKRTFHSVAKNVRGETMDWTGAVDGDQMTATALYTDKRGKTTKYAFQSGGRS